MHALASTAARVAHADVPVLITGPNGAGKEVIADDRAGELDRARAGPT